MAKKKNIKSGMDDVGLNKLSRLMLDQNNSLRKLLEELSLEENKTKVINSGADQNQVNNSKK